MERTRTVALILPFLCAAVRLPAQEEPANEVLGEEKLLELIQALDEGPAPTPGVLDGIDLKTASAETRKVVKALRETRLNLSIEKRDVPSTLELLGQVTGLNFLLSAKARESMEKEKPEVNLTLRGLAAENILNLLAVHLGEYRFTIRYGAVFLIRNEEYRPRRTLRFYAVHDLIRPRPDFPAPRLALGTQDEKQ